MSVTLFRTKDDMMSFFRRFGKVDKKIELHVFRKYDRRRLLVTAEHAYTRRTKIGNIMVGVGEKNVGWLARMGAYHARSAYTVVHMNRIYADAARPPEKLGKGVPYNAKVYGGGKRTKRILVHKRKNYLPYLEHYYNIIEEIDPSTILSVHGIGTHHLRKNDVILGFGRKKKFMNANPVRFRNELMERFSDTMKDIDTDNYPSMNKKIRIAIGRHRFTGSTNYILRKYTTNSERRGLHAEFVTPGRDINENISVEFQVLVQVLSEMLAE